MRRVMFSILQSACAVLSIAPVMAYGQAQMPVFIESAAQDTVGSRLAYAIREKVRQSSGFALVTTTDGALFRIGLVTLDPNANASTAGYSTIYSVVLTAWRPQTKTWTYINKFVGNCGSARVNECAESVMAEADKASDVPRNFYKTLTKK